MMKKFLCLLISFVICCSFAGCDEDLGEILTVGKTMISAMEAAKDPDGEKVFINNGLKMTLTNSFMDYTNTTENPDNLPILYASDIIGISAYRHEISEMEKEGIADLQQYAQWAAQNACDYARAMQEDGYWFFTYNDDAADTLVFNVVLESSTHYWVILATCPLDGTSKDIQTDMLNYLLTATFTES